MKFERTDKGEFIIPVDFNVGDKIYPLLSRLRGSGAVGTRTWYVGDETHVDTICPEIHADGHGRVYYKLAYLEHSRQAECVWSTREDAEDYIRINHLPRDEDYAHLPEQEG